ncbi:MAG: hypothetical protein ACRC7O_16685 [Fimbriiglobus sp.]
MTLRIVVLMILAGLGCGGPPSPLGAVRGTVTLDGKPLRTGVIFFDAPNSRPAVGTVVDGVITEVTTYTPGDGAAIGRLKVAVSATESPPAAPVGADPGVMARSGANHMIGKSLIPARYNQPDTSRLVVDIVRGENIVELALTTEK